MKSNAACLRAGSLISWVSLQNEWINQTHNLLFLKIFQLLNSTRYQTMYRKIHSLISNMNILSLPSRLVIVSIILYNEWTVGTKNKYCNKTSNLLFNVIKYDVGRIVNSNSKVKIILKIIKKRIFLHSRLLVDYILLKLARRFTISFIIKDVMRLSNLQGIYVLGSGRFNRKERASVHKFRKGALALSSRKSQVDFYSSDVVLKYGVCGIKVWSKEKNDFKTHKFKYYR